MTLTKEELDALKALHAKMEARGRAEPWFFTKAYTKDGLTRVGDGRSSGMWSFNTENPDAEYIVALVNAAPALIESAREALPGPDGKVSALHAYEAKTGHLYACLRILKPEPERWSCAPNCPSKEIDALKAKLAAAEKDLFEAHEHSLKQASRIEMQSEAWSSLAEEHNGQQDRADAAEDAYKLAVETLRAWHPNYQERSHTMKCSACSLLADYDKAVR